MYFAAAGCLFAMLAAVPDANPHDRPKIDPARIYSFDRQEIAVENFAASGRILDIGGGGEGVIGRLKGTQVVAIDLYAWGMKRTPTGPLKIVMDATDLKFLDASFGTVTSFFTLMYMSEEQQQKAFREAFRVLEPGGRMRVWEVDLPASPDPEKDVAMYPFTFRLPRETVETGYGAHFPKTAWNLQHYTHMAEAAGFLVESGETIGRTLRLVLRKQE